MGDEFVIGSTLGEEIDAIFRNPFVAQNVSANNGRSGNKEPTNTQTQEFTTVYHSTLRGASHGSRTESGTSSNGFFSGTPTSQKL